MSGQRFPKPTERIQFRQYGLSDQALVADLFGDDQARKFYPNMEDEAAHLRWIEWNLTNYLEQGFGLWVIESVGSGDAMGDCGLTLQHVAGDEMLEVGYHLKQSYRGKGYAIEAGKACVSYALGELGASSVCSIVDPDNRPSISVASRLHDSRSTFTDSNGNTMLLFVSR